MADAREASLNAEPMHVAVGRRVYRVLDRIAVGSVCTVYRCRFDDGEREIEGVFKVARDARANELVANEAAVLSHLQRAKGADTFSPFLPRVAERVAIADEESGPPREANVLRMHSEIRSPDELYTLAEVRSLAPAGLDPRHVAWIWRRLLTVLGFVHSSNVVHGAVLPPHVMIEPGGHKLLLIDWCCAVVHGSDAHPLRITAGEYTSWYKRERALRQPPTAGLDIGLGARCMVTLLGGDPISGECPADVEPAIVRHFSRCIGQEPGRRPEAWRLLEDFDALIGALWGPRHFLPLALPPKPSRSLQISDA